MKRFFTKKAERAPEELSDGEVAALAAKSRLLKGAEAVQERRQEAARAADLAKANEAAEKSKKARGVTLGKMDDSTLAEARSEWAAVCDFVTEAAGAVERFDALVMRHEGIRVELESLGVPTTAPTFANPPGTVEAALRLGQKLAEIVVAGDNTFRGETGDILARVHVGR